MRPPQPEVAPSGDEACHTDCWSLCENSRGGSGTLPAAYCAFVVGCTSVPTLSITPIRPLSKMALSGCSSGASAYCMPLASATLGASTVPASWACV